LYYSVELQFAELVIYQWTLKNQLETQKLNWGAWTESALVTNLTNTVY